MIELGGDDYHRARTKAAQRLGCKDQRSLPNNAEIEQALMEYQRLFHADKQKHSLYDLRQIALETMSNLEQFSPRLVGSVLNGRANPNSPLRLHLFTESPEQIAIHLIGMGIPYQEDEIEITFKAGQKQRQPAFKFHSGETEVELVWFPPGSIGHPPLSPIDQMPERSASMTQLRNLLEQN